jgi:hypothetical protein
MMEIVIPFTHRHQRRKHVISRRPPVVKRLLADPMRERIHTECSLLDETRSYDTSINQAAPPIAPSNTSKEHWEYPRRKYQALAVVLVLSHDDGITVEIADVRASFDFGVVVEDEPPHMRE